MSASALAWLVEIHRQERFRPLIDLAEKNQELDLNAALEDVLAPPRRVATPSKPTPRTTRKVNQP